MTGGMSVLYRSFTRLNGWLRLRLTALGRVVAGGTLAAAAFGIDIHHTAAMQLAAVGAGMLAVALPFVLRFRPGLQVRRELPDYATVGASLDYTLTLRNLSVRHRLPALGIVDELDTQLPTRREFVQFREETDTDNRFDRLLGFRRWLRLVRLRRGGIIAEAQSPPLAPSSEVSVRISLFPLRRGYVHFSSTIVQCPDPLGLMNAIRRVGTRAPLLVLPRRYRVPKITLGQSRRHHAGGLQLATNVGDSQEFLSLREYCRGDPMRHLHWRSWARTGMPIVKQFQDEYCSRQALVLDTFGAGGARFEAAVSLAASFVLDQPQTDNVIDLMFIGTEAVHAQSGRGLGGRARLLELLACAESASVQDFEKLTRLVLRSAPRPSAAIVILLDWDAARQELVRALRALRVPIAAIVVSDAPIGAPSWVNETSRFCVVHPTRIEQDLAQLAMPRCTAPKVASA